MAQEWAKAFYHSSAWLKCRDSYIKKVFGLCEYKGCSDPGYILHHKIRLTPENINDQDVTLNHDHLEFLCLLHHNQIDADKEVVREGLRFNEYGELIEE